MRFIQSLLAGAAFVAAAAAADVAITKGPDFGTGVEVGKSYTIEYTPADDTPTTIILRKGDGANLDTVGTLTESATSGSFTWTVDTALPNGDDYALEIQQGDATNYWGPFPLSGSSASATSSAASSTASASSSASSSKSESASTTAAPSSSATHASASSSVSFSGNSTISSATLSRSVTGTATTTPTGTAATTGASGVPTEGAAAAIGASPMAFIFGAVAAMAYLN